MVIFKRTVGHHVNERPVCLFYSRLAIYTMYQSYLSMFYKSIKLYLFIKFWTVAIRLNLSYFVLSFAYVFH